MTSTSHHDITIIIITAKELASQQVPVVLQERQVQVAEILDVPYFHFQFLRGIPVDNLHHSGRQQ